MTVDLEGVEELTQCDDCGRVIHARSHHRCDAGPHIVKTREDREERIARDDRPTDETVVYLRGRPDSAYHRAEPVFDLDDMTVAGWRPVCGQTPTKREWRAQTRGYLQRAGRYPCSNCHDVTRE